MRRKKHLEEKIASFSNLIECQRDCKDFREDNKIPAFIDFAAYFKNENPIHLELGCGKGQFLYEMAKRHPELNFVAMEVNRSVLCTACEKAQSAGLKNVLFLHCGAELLPKYIRAHSVARIYLNFSCPFPKPGYANRRLTNVRFLESYKHILAPGAEIWQKTDNMHFFEYSIEQFSFAGYRIKNVSLDLHNSQWQSDNIVTEYEKKFSEQGFRIYRLEAYL